MTEVIWITRTQPSADESAKVWQEAGFGPLILPLLNVVSVPHAPIPTEAVLIFTSKNAVDHVPCSGQRAICVGDATAECAKAAGFRDVVSVNGTSADITNWIIAELPKVRPIIHVSGRHIRGTICEDLSAAGYSASRMIVYKSVLADKIPSKPFQAVAFYSPLAAKNFAALMGNRDVSHVRAISISAATDEELEGLTLNARLIASEPTEFALVRAALTH